MSFRSGRPSRRRSPPARLPRVLAAALVAAAGAAAPPVHAGDAASGSAGGAPGAAAPDDAEARLRDRLAAGPGSTEADAVRAWSHDVAGEGRLRPATDLGGDLLSGAASALETRGLDLPRALSLVDEAIATYPARRAAIGFAWFERAVLLARLGDPEGALAALDTAARCAATPGGLDAPRDDADRRTALEAQLEGLGRAWRADLLAALGRHAEAAALHEETATHGGARAARRGGPGADGAWERAAIEAYRAGDRERADRDAGAAIDAALDDGRVVDLAQWRLYARHGALDARAEVRLTDVWPGDAFLEEARTSLHALEGRRGAWRFAMQVASSASAAGRAAEAVEMYEIALRDPGFEQEARSSPLARQRILTAALAALRAGDPAKARAWLERAVQYAGGPIAGTEGLSVAIDEALTRAETARLLAGTAPQPTPPPAPRGARRLGELVVPGASDVDDEPSGEDASGPPRGADDPGPPWAPAALVAALAAVGGVLAAAAALLRRGRSRRARAPRTVDGPGPPA